MTSGKHRGVETIAALLLLPSIAAAPKPPKAPSDAPYCAIPGARQIFVAPMGEPFRAASGQPYPSATWFAQADRNRDGMVDRAEFVADARTFFARLDTDHDGRLTPEEVDAYEHEVAPEIGLYSREREPGDERRRRAAIPAADGLGEALGIGGARDDRYGGAMGAGRYAWLNIPEPVASADADVDRLISLDEFLGAAARRFDVLDARRAGRLRLADLPRTPQQVAIEGPCRPRPKPKHRPGDDPFDDRDPATEPPR